MRCKTTDSQDTNRLQIDGCKLEAFNGGNLMHSLFTLRTRLIADPFSIRILRNSSSLALGILFLYLWACVYLWCSCRITNMRNLPCHKPAGKLSFTRGCCCWKHVMSPVLAPRGGRPSRLQRAGRHTTACSGERLTQHTLYIHSFSYGRYGRRSV